MVCNEVAAGVIWRCRRIRQIVNCFSCDSPRVISSSCLGSSIRVCASPYDIAARLRITALVKRTLTTSASGVISQIALNVSRSTPPLWVGGNSNWQGA